MSDAILTDGRRADRPRRAIPVFIWVIALVGALLLPGVARGSTFNATTVSMSPDGSRVYVGFDGLGFSAFSRDPASGALTLLGSPSGSSGGGPLYGPSIATTADGSSVYGVDSASNQLLQYGITSEGVASQGSYPVLADPMTAKAPIVLATSPDGTSVYVLTYGYGPAGSVAISSRGAITTYHRDPASGNLSLVGTDILTEGSFVTSVLVSPDGKFVYVGAVSGVDVFSRDATTGALTLLGREGPAVTTMAMSPDGGFVYVVGPALGAATSNAVTVLQRDSVTGALTQVEQITNGSGGVSSLSEMWGAATSSDGDCLYVTSRSDNSIGTFTRDQATGALTFAGSLTEGVAGVSGLSDARQVTTSSDNRNVYVASPGDSGVGVFARYPGTCSLSFVQLAQDVFSLGSPTVDSAQGVATLPVSTQTPGTLQVATVAAADQGQSGAGASTTPVHVGAGTTNLSIVPDAQDEVTLERQGQLPVNAAVTFVPDRGVARTKSTSIVLSKARGATSKEARSKIRRALLKFLIPKGKGARIETLLHRHSYRVRFASPEAGRLKVQWLAPASPARAKKGTSAESSSTKKARRVIVAGATHQFSKSTTSTIKIKLTARGHIRLEGTRRLKLTAFASFTPKREKPVAVTRSFTLRR
jgi:6-phosphogluconolactonase (cycloisomerase 2 family)